MFAEFRIENGQPPWIYELRHPHEFQSVTRDLKDSSTPVRSRLDFPIENPEKTEKLACFVLFVVWFIFMVILWMLNSSVLLFCSNLNL